MKVNGKSNCLICALYYFFKLRSFHPHFVMLAPPYYPSFHFQVEIYHLGVCYIVDWHDKRSNSLRYVHKPVRYFLRCIFPFKGEVRLTKIGVY